VGPAGHNALRAEQASTAAAVVRGESSRNGGEHVTVVTRELSGPYRMTFVVIFALLVVVVGGLPLALDGPAVGGAPWVGLTAAAVLLWRRARTRVLVDADGVLLANTFQVHRFEWGQVEGLRAPGNLVFSVRMPSYVDELRSSAVGGIGGALPGPEQVYLAESYRQLREYRSGTRSLEDVGRPSSSRRSDAQRWQSWRTDLIVFVLVAAAGPGVAHLIHLS
jgi:hypothetical protein